MDKKGGSTESDDVTHDVLRYKVLLLGDTGSGKTALTRALMGREFIVKLNTTVGIDFVKRGFEVDGAKVLLEVWDTAGQERFRSISRFHYRGTKGIVLMYDITDKRTFETLDYWMQSIEKDIDGKAKEPVPVFIVGNKIDLQDQRVISTEKGKKIADANFVHGFMETSAKESTNVQQVFEQLAYAMVEINDPARLGAYKHLRKKDGALSKPKDFTRSTEESLRLKKPPQTKKSCKCSKS